MLKSGDRDVALARVADALAGGFTSWAESPPAPDGAKDLARRDGLGINAGNLGYDSDRQIIIGKGNVALAIDQMELRGDRL